MLVFACSHQVPPPDYAFYHWQTELSVPDSLLEAHHADRLYIKVFDVSWENERAEPAAILRARDPVAVEAVPVVFLTNEVFRHPLGRLAEDVIELLTRSFPYAFAELQLDCDWTAGTRAAYFSFLDQLRQRLPGKVISCTVRLHQYRDRSVQGVPPVDRAVLMAYNTGELGSWETENSIVDTSVISSYLDGPPSYPLPLDLAVAAYDWAAVYRYGKLTHLINEPELVSLSDTTRFTQLAPLRYRVRRSTYYAGIFLYAGDLIRREVVTRPMAEHLIHSLWPRVASTGSKHVIVYRINSRQWAPSLPPS